MNDLSPKMSHKNHKDLSIFNVSMHEKKAE